MRKVLLASVMTLGLIAPVVADTTYPIQPGSDGYDLFAQAACNSDAQTVGKAGGFVAYARSLRSRTAVVTDEDKQRIMADICQRWQASQQAKNDYVPQWTDTDEEWHVITQDVHGDTVRMAPATQGYSQSAGAYIIPSSPQDVRVAIKKGFIFAIPGGTFDPKSIEMAGVFFGGDGNNVRFPTAAADPTPWECQIDNQSSKVLGKDLIRCRSSADAEWMSNDDRTAKSQ